MPGIRRDEGDTSGVNPEPLNDLIDLDDDSFVSSGELIEEAKKDRLAKATDVRRRIEERLEVRLLRDELGMDDLDI